MVKATTWIAVVTDGGTAVIVGEAGGPFWRFRSQMKKAGHGAVEFTWREDATKRYPDAMKAWRERCE